MDLPVAAILPELLAALAERPNAVLVAPPGAGKTTLVPAALLDAPDRLAPWRGAGRILVLEPRRLAARAAATRMAALRGEAVGGTIGYRTRLDSAVSARTRVEVVTQGLLVRRLLADPGLEGVAAVLLDEVHERSLDADLALALCLDLQRELRPELRLLAMSATADGERLAGLLDGPVIRSEGRLFPVEVRHAARDLAHVRDLPDAVAAAVRAALLAHAGDVLAFLPGLGEIRRVQAALEGCGALVLPLHGDLAPAEQDAALQGGEPEQDAARQGGEPEQDAARQGGEPEQDAARQGGDAGADDPRADGAGADGTGADRAGKGGSGAGVPAPGGRGPDAGLAGPPGVGGPRAGRQRRVVLATSIAETSLTVPGVRVVVDGGWRRSPRLDPASGLTRLVTVRVSRAAADQRAGRAGREAPGVAIRLWTAALHRGLPPFDAPEMRDAELSGLLLDCAAWGTAPDALPFPDPPPAGALTAAAGLLQSLGALDAGRGITPAGRRMAALGAHPRLAAMMLAAEDPAQASLAAELAALLEERDPLRPRPGPGVRDAPVDLALRLAALAGEAVAEVVPDRGALSRIRAGAAQYRRRLGTRAAPAGDPARLVAAAFPDRIAQRRGELGSFRLSGGGGARLSRTDPLAAAPLLAVAALQLGTSATIRLAAPLDPDALPPGLAALVGESVESGFDAATGAVLSRRRRRLGALVLEDRVLPADPQRTAAVLAGVLAGRLEQLPWSEAARQLQARAVLLRGLDAAARPARAPAGPDEERPDADRAGAGRAEADRALADAVPDLSDAALAADAGWLEPHLLGLSRLADAQRLDLSVILRGRLGHHAVRLDRELPTHLALPGGRAAVDYCQPVPVAGARAQHFYGLSATPRLAGGRVGLQLALLSPAGRAVAITADLAGFWVGAWGEVRREMRGRYPRHDWPERPG